MKLQAALIQMKVVEGKDNNLRTADRMLGQAASQGARLLVLPEMFNVPYDNSFFPGYAEEYPGETTEFLKRKAIELDVYIAGGSIPEREGNSIYNTSYVFSPKGELIGKHRKAHLFDIDVKGGITFRESDVLSPGQESTLFNVDGLKVGLIICYDIRFPEFTRKLALEGAQAVLVPAAFNMITGPAHWHLSARARALDNQVYMLLCSQSRNSDSSYTAYGHSLAAGPWGDLISELETEEGILHVAIDTDRVDKIRNELPLLKHRREELY
ncbi:MAG: carbon-nitrogen hydrolase family protein [Gudongella sp.]|nr:carbon-nitrogen hydrolase family protein [Gudongella sp.]